MHETELFLNDWRQRGIGALKVAFGLTDRDLRGMEILLASYSGDLCRGEAFVLLLRDNRLYEVNASHDSDQRLAGQWEPEDTSIEALRYRMEKGRLGHGDTGLDLFASQLGFLLAELEIERGGRLR